MGNFTEPLVINRQGEIWSPRGLVAHADSKSEMEKLNAIGADQVVTTMTSVLPTIIDQKYYELPLADIVDIEVGQGNPFDAVLYNWSTSIKGGDFESGLINMAKNKADANSDDIAVEPIERKVVSWKKDVNYNILEEGNFARGTKNLDYAQEKYKARKKQYDLGIQDTLMFGLKLNPSDYPGILTQPEVTSNLTVITKALSTMTATEFNTFIAAIIPTYMKECAYTARPNTFMIPAEDFYGLSSQMSPEFPVKTKLEVLEAALKGATGDQGFKVIPNAYCSKEYNKHIVGLNKNRYVLYRKAADHVIMNVPLDFTVTLPGTANNFDYTSAAYSRFTGVKVFRPQTMMYFDY